jgi:hypothetical protein
MVGGTFTEEDKTKLVEFLNFVAERASFPDWTTKDTIRHFKLLAHIQQVVLPKIDANILEIGKVVQVKEPQNVVPTP